MTIKLLTGMFLILIGLAALPFPGLHQFGRKIGELLAAMLLFAVLGLAGYGLAQPDHVAWLTGPITTNLVTKLLQESMDLPRSLWLLLGVAAILLVILTSLRRFSIPGDQQQFEPRRQSHGYDSEVRRFPVIRKSL